MDGVTAAKLIVLLLAANGAPIVARNIMGSRASWPLDLGARFVDGRPLFGRNKTLRGVASCLAVSALVAASFGMSWTDGLAAGALVMLGDLGSSFAKRRRGLTSGASAPVLDQVPEALLPLLYLRSALGFDLDELLALLAAFVVADVALSRLLYRLHVRRTPG